MEQNSRAFERFALQPSTQGQTASDRHPESETTSSRTSLAFFRFLTLNTTTMTTLALLTAWSPSISESSDGQPLVTRISDFVVDFPYDRLPDNKWLALTLRLEVVLLSIAFYLISEPLLKVFATKSGMNGKSTLFRTAVAVHNLALAVFSFVVAVNAWHVFSSHYKQRGWRATYCDQDGEFWASGNGTWSMIFYLSKYWEFVDTWILVIKVCRILLRVKDCLFSLGTHFLIMSPLNTRTRVRNLPFYNYIIMQESS